MAELTINLENVLNNVIDDFIDQIRQECLDYLDGKRGLGEYANDKDITAFTERNASGATRASIQQIKAKDMHGSLVGGPQTEFVFRGRGPGKFPPLAAIVDWCAIRGISRSLAFPIAKKIAEEGSKLYRQKINVLDLIVNEKRIDAFVKNIGVTMKASIKTDIETILKSYQ
jgi:hypothetical protein